MKRIIRYILIVLMGAVASCQRFEFNETLKSDIENGDGVYGKARMRFSAILPALEPTTKSKQMALEPQIETFHLVVFDTLGMLVEIAEANLVNDPITSVDRGYQQEFEVVLSLSEEPRIIHFIANCPVEQIVYGHETSIIGNLHVKDGEAAYWSRAELPHIKVNENEYVDEETGEVYYYPCEDIKEHLERVHLLRNFAQIMVEDETPDDIPFQLLGFSVINTINIGTVAPYNNKNQSFQCFVDWENSGQVHTYHELLGQKYPYEGHALSSATLIQTLPKDENEDYIWYGVDNPFFMYERKVSVRTDEEEKWKESPPHIIVRALYEDKECFYKFDLVYNVMDKDNPEMVSEIKYYNILRNFQYHFTIVGVDGPGYTTPEAAIEGTTSNNIAGSTTTSKFTEVSITNSNIAVSYTDTTLVDRGIIHFRYKYEPNLDAENPQPDNSEPSVVLLDAIGNVISSCKIAEKDIQSGVWQGYRDVELNVKEPTNNIEEQVITVKTENAYLSRKVRFILRKKLDMIVECEPRIFAGMDVPQTVTIKLPPGLTEDMFPLILNIEVKGLTLSPDAQVVNNHLPVQTGISVIPDKTQNSFYFTKTINTYNEYMNSLDKDEDNYRIVRTYWRTNIDNNASEVYVANKYFNTKSAEWTNVNYAFTNVAVTTQNISKGLDRDVAIQFTMDASDASSTTRDIIVRLDGLRNPTAVENDDETVMVIRPNASSGNVTVSGNGNAKTVTISGLKTTSLEGKVGFILDHVDYQLGKATSEERLDNTFNGSFNKTKVEATAGVAVNYTFSIPTLFQNMVVNVTLDGLLPQGNETKLVQTESQGSIRKYTFTPTATGTYTLQLQTANKEPSICSIVLETNPEYYYPSVTSTLNQAMNEFAGLTISNVKQGTGRPVTVSFVMASDDTNYANKDINVSLVGMKRNGTEAAFTVNTGDNTAVDRNGRTIPLKNILTSTAKGDLSVTVAGDDYLPKTATLMDRQPAQFSSVTLSPTSLGANAGEEVTLKFSSSDLIDGMKVILELDGLAPAGSLSTKAVTSHTYIVQGTGEQTLELVTTESTTSSRTCTVQLKADGFEDSAVMTVEQMNSVTYSGSNKTITIEDVSRPTLNGNWQQQYSYEASVVDIRVSNTSNIEYTATATYTYQGQTGTLTININSIEITGADISTATEIEVDWSVKFTRGKNSQTKTGMYKTSIDDLELTLQQ